VAGDKKLTASEIMKGVGVKKVVEVDSYPGLDAILKKARKIKPFSDTDKEQRRRALDMLLPSGVLEGGRERYAQQMEEDYVRAVAKWRADNWMLPIEKETEFPYSRTRNLGDAADRLYKYGANWLPTRDTDSGPNYDSEGEDLSFYQQTENNTRADIMEDADMRIKGLGTNAYEDGTNRVFLKMKAENAGIRKEFSGTKFNRFNEMMRTHEISGYTITPRFRAFKLFSREQQRLLEDWESAPAEEKAEKKKVLLAHVAAHGQLVRDVPEADPPAPKSKVEKKVEKKPVAVKVGSVLEVVDV
jgi:hypothetical protein